MENKLNLFWAVVWCTIAVLGIIALIWKPAIYFLIAGAAIFCAIFVCEYIRVKRMK